MVKNQIPWNKGKKNIYSEDTLEKMSNSHKRENLSKDTLEKMSKSQKDQIHSIESRKKQSERMTGKNHFMYGNHHTEETKRKIGDKSKGRIPTIESRQKMSVARKGKKLSVNTRKNISNSKIGVKNPMYGKPVSEETKQKIREKNSGNKSYHFGKLPSKLVGHGKRCYYESPLQGRICFRSTYELKFAQYLDKNNISWLYEIQTFDLGNTTYTPDFFLPTSNLFIEIKGYMTDKAQEKINKFLDNYIDETLQILYKEDLIKLGVVI